MGYEEAMHKYHLRKSAAKSAWQQYKMFKRIKKSELKWERREASGKASAGLRPVHRVEREEWVPEERPTISMVRRRKR